MRPSASHPKDAGLPASSDRGFTTRYEQLRRVALDGDADAWRHGLGVLAHRGVTGWITAHQTLPPPPSAPTAPVSPVGLPDAAASLVTVMAAMALAHLHIPTTIEEHTPA